jgi:hypothetical protein
MHFKNGFHNYRQIYFNGERICVKMPKFMRSSQLVYLDSLYLERLEVILVRAMVDPWPKWWSKNFITKPVQPVRIDKSIN